MSASDDGGRERDLQGGGRRGEGADDAPADEERPEEPTLTLSDALKLAGFAGTGGQAKTRIQAGDVLVNGRVETRRKRRLREGDEVTVDDETFVIELEE